MVTPPRRQGARPGEDGAVIVEFLGVFFLFLLLLWGLITYGTIFAVQQALTHASAEGARAMVGVLDEDEARARAAAIVAQQLQWLDGRYSFDEAEFASCDDRSQPPPADGPVCAYVEVSYPWRDDPVVPPLMSIATPSVLGAVSVLQHS